MNIKQLCPIEPGWRVLFVNSDGKTWIEPVVALGLDAGEGGAEDMDPLLLVYSDDSEAAVPLREAAGERDGIVVRVLRPEEAPGNHLKRARELADELHYEEILRSAGGDILHELQQAGVITAAQFCKCEPSAAAISRLVHLAGIDGALAKDPRVIEIVERRGWAVDAGPKGRAVWLTLRAPQPEESAV